MKKSILINVAIILLVIAMTAGATYAYFSGTDQEEVQLDTAKIELAAGSTAGFPLLIQNILPGAWHEAPGIVYLQNTGDAKADFFLQLIGKDYDNETNFCFLDADPGTGQYRPDQLWIRIYETDGNGSYIRTVYEGSLCHLYPYFPGATIIKLADDVNPGAYMYLKAYLYLFDMAGEEFENAYNQDIMNFIAVQYNGPAPTVVPSSSPLHAPWPAGDPNYE